VGHWAVLPQAAPNGPESLMQTTVPSVDRTQSQSVPAGALAAWQRVKAPQVEGAVQVAAFVVSHVPLRHWAEAQHTGLVPQQIWPEAQQVPLQTESVVLLGTHRPLHRVVPAGQVCADASEARLNPTRPPTVATMAALTALRRDTGAASRLVSSSKR
jgi:hypothetical protein